MPASKSLPVRPSLESLRKQAKTLARDRSVPLRDAQLLLAREYGYRGWQALTDEVNDRLGRGLESAAAEARRIIHGNDMARLKLLLAEYPALLSWQGDEGEGGVLGMATGAYGDCFDPFREQFFTRAECAEALIDAGAVVTPAVCDGLLRSRARGLLQLFQRKGLLPRTLKFLAALGDVGVISNGDDRALVGEAFAIACDFKHETVASRLLDRSIALDPGLGTRIDESVGRRAFIEYFTENRPAHVTTVGLWKAFVMERVSRAAYSWSGHETSLASPSGHTDQTAFVELLRREAWLLGDAFVGVQADIIGRAALHGRGELITALLDLDPAILRLQPPPESQAIEFAFTYAKTHVLPMLTRIWPVPDDLPHAAGMGNLAQVKKWFDGTGAPALGNVARHYPRSPYMPKARVDDYAREWGPITVQRVLDAAFAWSVINSHLDVAQFLLDHGADINTTWSSHEPASILHELVFHANYESMQFLIDRGIDMKTRDYRWNATAQGWALHAANDEKMAQWLEDAERRRQEQKR